MLKIPVIILISILLFSNSFITKAQQEENKNELESRVPELDEFHDIIYPIWHTAYPEKDYKALINYSKEINERAEKIYNAKLPGILRDKKEAWERGVTELKKTVDQYSSAAENKNDENLLNAAETLHSNYEKLVRIIRPAFKEVDDFHKLLYVIYHHYLPSKNYDKIREVRIPLYNRAKAIANTKLASRFDAKKDKIKIAANDLLHSVKVFRDFQPRATGEEIESAVEEIHTKYQRLDEIF